MRSKARRGSDRNLIYSGVTSNFVIFGSIFLMINHFRQLFRNINFKVVSTLFRVIVGENIIYNIFFSTYTTKAT